ncbi:MAG: indolepyruvate oxidoreductase subunit beta [Spirochaeta sp.]|jgi:indolepyruvate ferredoxin oxidoreductase beta subunit|nr:indolepyruvate oxidoreductase subunit beta [Spirochaeta sp.]
MKTDIILAGVGGQGILSIAAVLGFAAMNSGLHVKQAEVHGMSQRGGAVQSHLRISDTAIHSDLIPRGGADMILSVEPLESLRYLEYLAPAGRLVTNTTPERNIPNYPEITEVLAAIEHVAGSITIDADAIAAEANNRRGMNMVMTGAASPFLSVSFDALTDAVRSVFARKGEAIIAANIAALEAGRSYVAARLATTGETR